MSDTIETKGKVRITPSEFLTAWCEVYNAGGTVKQVAAQLGAEVATLQTRASAYRKKGIAVPKFTGGRTDQAIDVVAANQHIAGLLNISVDELVPPITADEDAPADAPHDGGETLT